MHLAGPGDGSGVTRELSALAPHEIVADIAVSISVGSWTPEASAADKSYPHQQHEWDRLKTPIVTFYQKKGNSIFNVRDQMITSHNFRASIRQYKYQLNKWKIAKNMPATDKDAAGEEAEVCFRDGKPLPLKRRDGSLYQWEKVRRRDLSNGHRVEFWKQLELTRGFAISKSSRNMWAATPLVHNINDPDVYYYNGLLLKQVRSFVPVSCVKAGLQDSVGDSALYHHVRRLYLLLCNDDSPTYDTKEMIAGTRLELRRYIQNPSVVLLMDLINICGWGRWRRHPRLRSALEEILSMVRDMTAQSGGCLELFGNMVRMYCRLDTWPTNIWHCLLKEMGDFQGLPAHAHAFAVHQVAKFQFIDNKFDLAVETIDKYIVLAEAAFGKYSHWPRKLKLLSAVEGYDKRAMYTEAKVAYEYASNTVLENPDEITVRGYRGLLGLYANHQAFYNSELQMYYARKTFEASLAFHTAFDSGTLWDLGNLRKVLKEFERFEELEKLEMDWQVEREKAQKALAL